MCIYTVYCIYIFLLESNLTSPVVLRSRIMSQRAEYGRKNIPTPKTRPSAPPKAMMKRQSSCEENTKPIKLPISMPCDKEERYG